MSNSYNKGKAWRPKSRPTDISQILESTLSRRHLDKKLEQYAAFPLWPEIVGEAVAKVSRPQKILAKRLLVIEVSDAVWAQELSLQKSDLLKKIRASDMGAGIDDLRFVTGSPKSFK